MNHRQIYSVIIFFLAIVVLGNVANAQSRDRDNPTRLTTNIISGHVDSEVRGNYYFYSFTANPGEVVITLTVEPGRAAKEDFTASIQSTAVGFTLFDRNAAVVADKGIAQSLSSGSGQSIARVEVTRRQTMLLSVHFADGVLNKTVGGKYRIRIEGSIELSQGGSTDSKEKSDASGCLPKRGTLIIKMKDGSKKIIDLNEAETITVVP